MTLNAVRCMKRNDLRGFSPKYWPNMKNSDTLSIFGGIRITSMPTISRCGGFFAIGLVISRNRATERHQRKARKESHLVRFFSLEGSIYDMITELALYVLMMDCCARRLAIVTIGFDTKSCASCGAGSARVARVRRGLSSRAESRAAESSLVVVES